MQISWLGQSCFHITVAYNKQEDIKVLIDPFSEEAAGLKLPALEADILLVSHAHKDHNNTAVAKDSPFLIDEPGEYEVKDIFIQGIPSFHDSVQGKERGNNIIFTIEAEEIKLCHLGDLGEKSLSDEQLEKIGNVDILMIPVGGVYTIDGKEAQPIIAQIEPKLVIPMHYSIPKLKVKLEGLDKFLAAMGRKLPEIQKKLKIQAKDLTEEETQLCVLEPGF